MRRLSVALMVVMVVTGACSSESEGDVDTQVPRGAVAAADEYIRALQESDGDGFLAIVNPAVYEYVFSETSWGVDVAQGVADGEMVVEIGDTIAVHLDHTITNTVYVAVEALRPIEPTAVNGIMVIEIAEFPDRGWLVTRDYRHGL